MICDCNSPHSSSFSCFHGTVPKSKSPFIFYMERSHSQLPCSMLARYFPIFSSTNRSPIRCYPSPIESMHRFYLVLLCYFIISNENMFDLLHLQQFLP
ncbi:hypothetical protein L1987_85068 [Smallanthus sonchifolius]|uniref:Uncharacterized protein n=1 Tax=Smallanthus sonchifolius TaxID=185202 RepID=A0ACB8XW54_9ASTR|nr:hypothetical protein L1987_85068 [Smallanthus sonchifolius]